jgi:hypothetical protein
MMTMMFTGGLTVIFSSPHHAKLWHRRRDDLRHGGAALRADARSRRQRPDAAVLRLVSEIRNTTVPIAFSHEALAVLPRLSVRDYAL